MAGKIYAVVGSFAMKLDAQKGVHIFRYEPERAEFTKVGDYRPEINAGQGAYDKKRDVVYVTNESKDLDGGPGGGGQVLSFKLDHETGEPHWLNEKNTYAPQPTDICLDGSGRYGLVPHHGAGGIVTKTKKREDGSFYSYTDSDDCTMALFHIHKDGSWGEMADAAYTEIERENGRIKKIPHLHCCVLSPDQKLFLACDKGLDLIHAYHLDTEKGKIQQMGSTFVEEGAHPRYGVFHPTLPIFYQNCENSVYVHVWEYDSGSGELRHIQKTALLADEAAAAAFKEESCADLVMTPDGKFLYVSVRGLNVVSCLEVNEDGTLKLLQSLSCQGKNPRGLALSPDGRYLFAVNRDSGQIARFRRLPDGMVQADGIAAACSVPGNMQFIVYEP